MKKFLLWGILLCFGCGMFLSLGCVEKAASVNEAIQNSQAYKTVQEKVNYLVGQAQAFYNSKQYQDAVNVANYVLGKLDANSQAAKDLIEKAKSQLQAMAQQATGGLNKFLSK